MKNKSQAAVEYLVVAAVLIMLILPGIYVFYEYSHTSTKEIALARINDIGKKIIGTAEQVYYLGEDSKLTLIVNMPEEVTAIRISETGKELVFVVYGSEVVFTSDVPMAIPLLEINQDLHTDNFNSFFKEAWSTGQKEIALQSTADSVTVSIK